MFKYFPHTEEDIKLMLQQCGLNSLDELYQEIPDSIRFKGDYEIPSAMSEIEIRRHFEQLGAKNRLLTCFAGAGCYDHYTPSVIPAIVQRSEYLTSYTPYQAEISQGTLHYIFEYQTMMSRLTGLPISNASMYDGATATAEAAMMMMGAGKKATSVLMSETVDPKVQRVVETYAHFHGFEIKKIAAEDGATSREDMQKKLSEGGVAGVILQQPNYYGVIEDYAGFADDIHAAKALLTINSVAADLALLKTPAEWGADIAVGDGQSLGVPMSFGGPSVGYMCCTEKLMRKMPGRIVGQTLDNKGQRCYVLTLQAREQHIRRQKATSNICSNQSLMALFVTIYCSMMGKQGLREAAQLSYAGAHYLAEKLCEPSVPGSSAPETENEATVAGSSAAGQEERPVPGLSTAGVFSLTFNRPFFNEFCVNYTGDIDALQRRCIEAGFLAGVKVADHTLMLAVTENRSKEEIDKLIKIMKG